MNGEARVGWIEHQCHPLSTFPSSVILILSHHSTCHCIYRCKINAIQVLLFKVILSQIPSFPLSPIVTGDLKVTGDVRLKVTAIGLYTGVSAGHMVHAFT